MQSLVTVGTGATTLLVVFNSWGVPFDGYEARWEMYPWTSVLPVDVIRFAERGPDQAWYCDKTKRICALVGSLAGNYEQVLLIGLSSGGYASLLISEMLAGSHPDIAFKTFSVNPQTSLSLSRRKAIWKYAGPGMAPPMLTDAALERADCDFTDLDQIITGPRPNLEHTIYYDLLNPAEEYYIGLVKGNSRVSLFPNLVGTTHIQSTKEVYLKGDFQRAVVSAILDYPKREIEQRDVEVKSWSRGFAQSLDATTTTLRFNYAHVFGYGQSNVCGCEAYPAKTLESVPNVLMLGRSVRPGGAAASPDAKPLGDTTLRPAVGTVQDIHSGERLSARQQSTLPRGSHALGEEVLLAGMQFAADLFLSETGVREEWAPKLILSNVGVLGQRIETLSRGDPLKLFNRFGAMAKLAKMRSEAVAGTYGVAALVLVQGESNYGSKAGATTDKDAYKGFVARLYNDFVKDVVAEVSDQKEPPAMIMCQTGGIWTDDETDLSIGCAQWELCQENLGWYLAAPIYPVTNKSGHVDANGARWLSLQIGKVFHQSVVKRRPWLPLSPLHATVRGHTILIDFHVPCPPLQFRPVLFGSQSIMYPNRGFTVMDDDGEVPLAAVSLAGETLVSILLSRRLRGWVNLYYGRKEPFNGAGNLCDSDSTEAPFLYEYEAGSGDYAEADIHDLVGKPYPLWNWCIAFKSVVQPDELETVNPEAPNEEALAGPPRERPGPEASA